MHIRTYVILIIIIIKVSVKRRILVAETFLSAYTHTHVIIVFIKRKCLSM